MKQRLFFNLIVLLLSIPMSIHAKHFHKEKYYQRIFCMKFRGIMEYSLKDATRVDCLTSSYAVEVDFSSKWAESIGQSLYYSKVTGKHATVLLITERPRKDVKYIKRLLKVAKDSKIRVYTIDSQGNIKLILP